MPRVAAPRLVFEDGELPIESLGLLIAVPVDALEDTPTRFVYTGYREVTLSVSVERASYAQSGIARGGGKCQYAAADGAPFGGFSFMAEELADTYAPPAGRHTTITGKLYDPTLDGRLLPDELNSSYASMHRALAAQDDDSDWDYWDDEVWDE